MKGKMALLGLLAFSVVITLGCSAPSSGTACGDGICELPEMNPDAQNYCPEDCGSVPSRASGAMNAVQAPVLNTDILDVEAVLSIESVEQAGERLRVVFLALCLDHSSQDAFSGLEKCTLYFGDGESIEITPGELAKNPFGARVEHYYHSPAGEYQAVLESENADSSFEARKKVKK